MQSTARQLDSSTARQLGQTSTDLDSYSTPRRMQSASTGSTATRQLLDSYLTGSTSKALRTAPRQRLDGCSGGALPLETGLDRSPDTGHGHGCAPGLNQGSGRQAGPQCVGSRSVNGASGPARRYRHPRLYYYPWARREKPVASKRSARFQSLTGPPRGAQNLHAIIGALSSPSSTTSSQA